MEQGIKLWAEINTVRKKKNLSEVLYLASEKILVEITRPTKGSDMVTVRDFADRSNAELGVPITDLQSITDILAGEAPENLFVHIWEQLNNAQEAAGMPELKLYQNRLVEPGKIIKNGIVQLKDYFNSPLLQDKNAPAEMLISLNDYILGKIIPISDLGTSEIMDKSWANHGQIMGESYQNHGQIMGESCQNHGRIMPKSFTALMNETAMLAYVARMKATSSTAEKIAEYFKQASVAAAKGDEETILDINKKLDTMIKKQNVMVENHDTGYENKAKEAADAKKKHDKKVFTTVATVISVVIFILWLSFGYTPPTKEQIIDEIEQQPAPKAYTEAELEEAINSMFQPLEAQFGKQFEWRKNKIREASKRSQLAPQQLIDSINNNIPIKTI